MQTRFFGVAPDGTPVTLYTVKNDGCELTVSNFGATVTSLKVFGREIVGGFDTLTDYIKDDSHQGGTIGRVANRIAGAEFVMDGKKYTLTNNDNGNCLHGGVGFDRKIWTLDESTDTALTFSYVSPDNDEGFPSQLKVSVRFTLLGSALAIEYRAVPSGKTPIALTNHSYFNLDGFGGSILDHEAVIYADRYTEADENLIPNGKRPSVVGTHLDFTEPHKIGERFTENFDGYDHNFILSPGIYREFLGSRLGLAAEVWNSDLKLSLYTDQVGVQFYTGNFLGDGPDFRGGVKQIRHGAFCLEPQTEPNCIKQGEAFYDAGEVYGQVSVYLIEKM